MSKIEQNVLFKKMQKDDKKEVLVFQVNGDELENAQTLVELAGGIVVLSLEVGGDTVVENLNAEFASLQRDNKKTALKFNVKGDSEDKAIKLYPFAGRNVMLSLQASQMSIDDYYGDEPDEGLEYDVNRDGTVTVKDDPNQMTTDQVEDGADGAEDGTGKVADLDSARNKKKDKKAEKPSASSDPVDDDDELPI